jgi:hypothetical protein
MDVEAGFCNPLSKKTHLFGVEMIHNEQPCKDLSLGVVFEFHNKLNRPPVLSRRKERMRQGRGT